MPNDLWKPDDKTAKAIKRGKRKVRQFYRAEGLKNTNRKGKRQCVTCRKQFKPKVPTHVVCSGCYYKAVTSARSA